MNVAGDSNDANNFPHKLLLTTQVSKIRKAFANGWSETQLAKIVQWGLLGRLLRPLLKTRLP